MPTRPTTSRGGAVEGAGAGSVIWAAAWVARTSAGVGPRGGAGAAGANTPRGWRRFHMPVASSLRWQYNAYIWPATRAPGRIAARAPICPGARNLDSSTPSPPPGCNATHTVRTRGPLAAGGAPADPGAVAVGWAWTRTSSVVSFEVTEQSPNVQSLLRFGVSAGTVGG